ncbi:TyrS-associated PheT N-terminal domain-related protein TapR [[Mycoplasma] mobile]|uniref:EMAP domain-containing protein n=1 Tax=Mycoplasma mobile (strain ATCC 43663 / 163K / NCTC 11711) TaxID=267748 RepID=Q6KHB3_MYCM1|nr:EMAP domain-containing protein [[Mycoplasma] mobile]AAT28017.1 EMAP domain-containing protein [Mycoplasma mobile 163K]
MALIFKQSNNFYINFNNLEEDLRIKQSKNFCFIYSKEKLVALNIFDFDKFSYLKEGFSILAFKEKNILLEEFPEIFKDFIFQPFYLVGFIEKIEKHPNSDKLIIINIKSNKNYKIVTNRIDLKQGEKLVFATSNSYLPNGLKISNSKVVNIESEGMILSYKSLNLKNSDELIKSDFEIGKEFVF